MTARTPWCVLAFRAVVCSGALLIGSVQAAVPDLPCGELETALAPGATGGIRSADECLVVDDAEKYSTVCSWRFALGSRDAVTAHNHLIEWARDCLGTSATERVGEPVNHPDAFVAHYFDRDNATLSVALKHKAALRETRVTLRFDRPRPVVD